MPSVLHHAYVRWLNTQGWTSEAYPVERLDGWLVRVPALHARRAPGRTCIAALQDTRMGTMDEPLNGSKGCGGLMRVAPVGLFASDPFHLGCEIAALTHGYPTGYLAAGAFAVIIYRLVQGDRLEVAVHTTMDTLRQHRGHEEISDVLQRALHAAAEGAPTADRVEDLRQGWVAEEALAIAVYAALAAGGDLAAGVRLAVNHSGDSDSTGAIAGNLLSALLGVQAIPERWLESLELRAEITVLADDLLVGYRDDEAWWERYRGW